MPGVQGMTVAHANLLSFPEHMLFVVRQSTAGRNQKAAMEVRRELEALQVNTVPENDRDAVLRFARAG